jgi:hypothetical protein
MARASKKRRAEPPPGVPGERVWRPPARNDQPPGEHVVQVNDAYTGGRPPEDAEPVREQQHQTGG